jgi:hypothetical protein
MAPGPAKKRSQRPLVLAIVVVVALGVGAGVYVSRDRNNGPPHPKDWDPRVLDIVSFDEQHRQLTYKHPVFIDFVTAEEYSKRTRTEQGGLSEQDKKDLESGAAQLRALGLASDTLDLFSAANDLADNGTLAFYDPETERVTVRGTELTVDVKVTLAHELTHVLQDQYFDIKGSRFADFKTSGEREAFRAVVEGDAVRIENEYVDSLSSADQAAYRDATKTSVDTAKTDLHDVPAALQALQQAPYIFGPRILSLIEEKDGSKGIDDLLRTPPTTEEELVDPRALFAHEGAKTVGEPALPDGVKDRTDSGDFGALSMFILLGERIDPLQALTAADGWGGDAYTSFEQDGRACIRIGFTGDTDQDTTEIKDALTAWAAAMPAGAASVEDDGGTLLLQSCDPGKDSGLVLNNRALDLVVIPAIREEVMVSGVKDGGFGTDKAFELGDCFVRHLTFEQISALAASGPDLSPELTQALQAAGAACR